MGTNLHELQQRRHDNWVIVVAFCNLPKQREEVWIQSIEQQRICAFVVSRHSDAAQIPQCAHQRHLDLTAGAGSTVIARQAGRELIENGEVGRNEGVEEVVQVLGRGEDQTAEGAVECDAVLVVVIVRQEWEIRAIVIVN